MKSDSINMTYRLTCSFAVLAGTLAVTGCEDFGGGASVEPNVTFVPEELGGGEAAGETTTNATEDASATPVAGGGDPGSFKGRVVMVGGGTQPPPLYVKGADIKDKEVCAAVPVPNESLVLGADNGVQNVFIFMKKAPKGAPKMTIPDEPIFFDQKNCTFKPHCLIVPVGQVLKVLSDDGIAHNTHTNPAKNNGVSSVVPKNDRVGVLELKYTRAEEPFSVTCDFHAWMKAYHLPLDHPYGAVTDENGNFEIKDIPPGEHDFVVWHESANKKYVERKLTVKIASGAATEKQIDYDASKLNLP